MTPPDSLVNMDLAISNTILLTLTKTVTSSSEKISSTPSLLPLPSSSTTHPWVTMVPYPIAFTRDSAYFLLENDAIPLTRFTRTLTVKDKKNLYSAYYGYHPDLHITHAPTNFNSPLAPFSTKTLYTETY